MSVEFDCMIVLQDLSSAKSAVRCKALTPLDPLLAVAGASLRL